MVRAMLQNKTFYPTPKPLIRKMAEKIKQPEKWTLKVLEPQAGKGDIIKYLTEDYSYSNRHSEFRNEHISAIEIDQDLQATLIGKGIRVIDSDFLSFSGPDKFDLIIANPPFDEGDKHLLKAIDIMYHGEIVFLLNAETIRNPYTNIRKELAKKLSELNADVEYIQGAFQDSQRPTGVEIALVYINIERKVEDDLFKGVDDKAPEFNPEIETNHEVSNRKTVQEMVAEYNQIVIIGIQTITDYYKNYRKVGTYIGLNKEADRYASGGETLTGLMKMQVNDLVVAVRKTFWRKTLDLKEVTSRLTSEKRKEFDQQIEHRSNMDFTESNIRQFVLNLIGNYEQTLTEAVMDLFDTFTIKNSYSGGLYDDNIHYFSGWKTNNAFKVGKKVIIPIYRGYSKGPFIDDYSGKWKLQYGAGEILSDIDKVCSYFDGMNHYRSITSAIESAFAQGQSRKIESTYFTITCYKKGTIHLVFNDENIRRRFNVTACKGKEWLMHEYGKKRYNDMTPDEKQVVDSFEGKKSYDQNLGTALFAPKEMLKIAA